MDEPIYEPCDELFAQTNQILHATLCDTIMKAIVLTPSA